MKNIELASSHVASGPFPDAWTRSWLYVSPGNWGTFVWIAGIHACAFGGLLLLPAPTAGLLVAVVALAFLRGLGTTICYHRSLSHRALSLRPWLENAMILLACFNGSSHPTRR